MKFGVLMTVFLLLLIVVGGFFLYKINPGISEQVAQQTDSLTQKLPLPENPLSIEKMRQDLYPGSDFVTEEILSPGANYSRSIVSYQSEGLKINGYLTVPNGNLPGGGWPVIIFNHGFIPPDQYLPTERYIAYVDAFARNGYVVFRPDYRGHGNSEGQPEGAYFSPGYTVDVLNAFYSVRKRVDINKEKMGMWGHSMGGNIIQRALVISPDIKAAVVWGGVVGSYQDIFENWWNKRSPRPQSSPNLMGRTNSRQMFLTRYGSPSAQSSFWQKIDPAYYIQDVNTPLQIHHGLSDETVPWQLGKQYNDALVKAGKTVEYYEYPGADHNLSQPFSLAIERSVNFFDKYLKTI
jgi:dipeptidyl aminopeptidase/acylaminoacyl peptidase